jgi:hypothetical protein
MLRQLADLQFAGRVFAQPVGHPNGARIARQRQLQREGLCRQDRIDGHLGEAHGGRVICLDRAAFDQFEHQFAQQRHDVDRAAFLR